MNQTEENNCISSVLDTASHYETGWFRGGGPGSRFTVHIVLCSNRPRNLSPSAKSFDNLITCFRVMAFGYGEVSFECKSTYFVVASAVARVKSRFEYIKLSISPTLCLYFRVFIKRKRNGKKSLSRSGLRLKALMPRLFKRTRKQQCESIKYRFSRLSPANLFMRSACKASGRAWERRKFKYEK